MLHAYSFLEILVRNYVEPVDLHNLPETRLLKIFQHLTYAFDDLP